MRLFDSWLFIIYLLEARVLKYNLNLAFLFKAQKDLLMLASIVNGVRSSKLIS